MATRRVRSDPWEWLTLVDSDGPFLSKAALKSFYPQGLPIADPSVDDVNAVFVQEHTRWLQSSSNTTDDASRDAQKRWVTVVLRDLLGWSEDLQLAPSGDLSAQSPSGAVQIRPWAALETDGAPRALVMVVDRAANLRAAGTDGWAASTIDRMATLLRASDVTIGLVTDGRWWGLVSSARDVTTASGVFDAQVWREERQSRDAFFALASVVSIARGAPEKRLQRVFAESVASAEQITEALGDQVRRAVELVLQSFSDVHLRAVAEGLQSPLPKDPRQVYDAAVTVLMRTVFLLFAEQRGLLPEHALYRSAYGVAGVREQLEREATAGSLEALDHTFETWHRLLAASNAIFHGASFEDVRMPAYGGSLFDPERFPWLTTADHHGRLRVRLSDRAMLAVLNAVQVAVVGSEARLLSFRELDVEQIGYVYEGLLGYSAVYAPELIVGLDGKPGYEPELPLGELEAISVAATSSADFAKRLLEHLKKTQEHAKPKTANQIAKTYASTDAELQAEARTKLRHTLLGDDETAARLLPFAGLIRNDLREFPYVVPADGIVMTESPQRANTGTHYTPRSLAEEVVLHALEPLVYSPGPLDNENSDEWVLKSSAEILDLKVADIAVGSGAFLVAAARYLADRLIEAREREGAPIDGEDPRRFAVREVVARCLYGADINGMAVEMCKLSLWLISMDPGKPFSFVDDRVFHGNSLLGVTTEAQLRAQHIYPKEREANTPLRRFDVERDLEDAARLRSELASGQVDDADRMRSTRAKRALLDQSRKATTRLRSVADGIVAAGLAEGGKPGRKLEKRYDELADALRNAYPTNGSPSKRRQLDKIIEFGLTPTVDTGDARWKPLHWILEAPDVIHDHGGFDAIIGNPPFLGGTGPTIAFGTNFREWLRYSLGDGAPGAADLAAYFFLRATSLLRRPNGVFGLIATNTISEGDTREVGLDQILKAGVQLFRADKSVPWSPASASVHIARVWGAFAAARRILCDGVRVELISSRLVEESPGQVGPTRLRENQNLCFKGSNVYGEGFILTPTEAAEMIAADPRNGEVIFPFPDGKRDISERPSQQAGRFVINFRRWPVEVARTYTAPFDRVEQLVRPVRALNNRKARRERWWQFGDFASGLDAATQGLEHVVVMVLHSSTVMPTRVGSAQTFGHALAVFPEEDFATLAFLSSAVHQWWSITRGSTLGAGIRYTPTDVFETLPRPENTERARELGEQLDRDRREIMLRRQLGLTALYNRVNSPDVHRDADVDLIRSIHVKIDEAMMEAYGWTDLLHLDHGFHLYRQVMRWTVSPAARVEILNRLLEENHIRAALEARTKSSSKHGKSFEDSEKPEGALI